MEPLNRSLAIVTLLRSHGLTPSAARGVAHVGEALHGQMGTADVEVAALLDAATGAQIGDVLIGQADQVRLQPHLAALRSGGRYVHVHTHPASGSFSDFDLTLLLGHPPIRCIVALGRDRTWYFLSKRRGQPTADPEDAYEEWGVQFTQVYARYDALVRSGALTETEALRAMTHAILSTLAPPLQLRYDRLEPR
jgi:hypothetical protein